MSGRGYGLLTVTMLASLMTGCSLAMMAPLVVDGQPFPVEQTVELRAGMSPDDVETLLGAPLRRSTGATPVWRYDFTRRLKVCRMYVGPIPLEPAATERHALELVFSSNGLQRALYREVVSGRKAERVVVDAPARAGYSRAKGSEPP